MQQSGHAVSFHGYPGQCLVGQLRRFIVMLPATNHQQGDVMPYFVRDIDFEPMPPQYPIHLFTRSPGLGRKSEQKGAAGLPAH